MTPISLSRLTDLGNLMLGQGRRVTWCGLGGIGVTWGVWKPVKSTSKLRCDKTIPCQTIMMWAVNLEVEIRALILGLCARACVCDTLQPFKL